MVTTQWPDGAVWIEESFEPSRLRTGLVEVKPLPLTGTAGELALVGQNQSSVIREKRAQTCARDTGSMAQGSPGPCSGSGTCWDPQNSAEPLDSLLWFITVKGCRPRSAERGGTSGSTQERPAAGLRVSSSGIVRMVWSPVTAGRGRTHGVLPTGGFVGGWSHRQS